MSQSLYSRIGKRCFDLAAAGFGIALVSPLLVCTALAVRLSSSGAVLFRQVRVGQFGRPFRMFKFRSMREGKEMGSLLTAAGDPRITPLGAWLRRFKVDELPQLINVLLGDMSLVGPRPELPEFVRHYTASQKEVLNVRPGMTGLSANVFEEEILASRENKEEFYLSEVMPQKLDIDLEYCRTVSAHQDIRILYRTFSKLLMRRHICGDSGTQTKGMLNASSFEHQERETGLGQQSVSFGRTAHKSQWLYTRYNQMILDGLCFALSLWLACLISFNAHLDDRAILQLAFGIPILVALRLIAHSLLGIYRQVWKFISFSDVAEISKSISIVSCALLFARFVVSFRIPAAFWITVPVSTWVLEGFLSISTSVGVRALRRVLYIRQRKAETAAGTKPPQRIFLYGAGRAGIMLRRELEINNSRYEVIGFIDDDPRKIGSVISNTRVVGSGEQLGKLAEKYKVDEVIISMATASRMTLSLTLAKCRRANVPAKIIPSLGELISGQVHISQFRDTKVEEVLGRDSVEVADFEGVAGSTYRNKRVLVTGAGGSIGSEAVRQLIRLQPSAVATLDLDENAIYELDQELSSRKALVAIRPYICNVTDSQRLRAVFSSFRPEIVIHAAAHKHVPLMELQPSEAVLNNVVGTQNVLEVSDEVGVERLVFISSDKAVNPVNVMGATKRIGELLVQTFRSKSPVRLACVRFGNVLGSQGSVIPLFRKQIANGGPVTVTHPEMVRYFMTVQEAVQLVLCAGTLANRGETFVLSMGKPRNILELAREIILLAGLEPGRDIQTVIIGLRPGEKMSEELVASSECLVATRFEKLSVIAPQTRDTAVLLRNVTDLIQCARRNEDAALHDILFNMDLGYSNSVVFPSKSLVTASSN